jgi:hypothetical protein
MAVTDSGFQAQCEAIRAHATEIRSIAAGVAEGSTAAASTTLGPQAYGFLCRIIPALLEPVQDAVVTALREATDSLDQSADDLCSTAAGYDESDTHAAGRLGR